jgi:hypothetical protein
MRAIILFALAATIHAEPARIHVFVALADNKTQGIAPVPEKIGNGDDAERNLYWGCSDALKPVLKASGDWKLTKTEAGPKAAIIERAIFTHKSGRWQIVADAYRGGAIRECTGDFFTALAGAGTIAEVPLVAYIGHDGLMEFTPPPESIAKKGPGRAAIVLCCSSRSFFGPHLDAVNARPVLLTTQLMYPGGFILRAALDGWVRGESNEQVRQRAAAAYARNQRISVKAAAGVFVAGR